MTESMSHILRRLIRDAGQPLQDVERATGVARESVARFLAGRQSLRLDLADKLANYFGVRVLPPDARPTPFTERRFIMDRPIEKLAARVLELKPGITLSNLARGWFIVGDRIVPKVSVQCLFRKSPVPHYSVGLAFDEDKGENARAVNEANSRRYQAFLASRSCPEKLEPFNPGKVLLYYRAAFPLTDSSSLERAARFAVWLDDQPFGRVP